MPPENGSDTSRPAVALMGEFSAGKSTLANILLGEQKSPVKVTATQQPPIWYTWGNEAAHAVDTHGETSPVDLALMDQIDRKKIAYVKVSLQADVLQMLDLIDMPGISDPNTPSEIWKRVIGNADHVIWCTHAMQAWRQSEAATWEELPPSLYDKSLLLLTRIDKIRSEEDRRRLMARVRHETQGLFADVFPISLLEASLAADDRDAWEASGAEVFFTRLIDMLNGKARKPAPAQEHSVRPTVKPPVKPKTTANRIIPRRVRLQRNLAHTPRPTAGAARSAQLSPPGL